MKHKTVLSCSLLLFFVSGLLFPPTSGKAASPALPLAQSGSVTAYDLILAMNTLRVSNGLPALVEDPIINAVAQATAEIMAANQMSWHIGDVDGRLQAAGYGGGAKVWGTENFAVGNQSIDEIMVVWSDASHMIPAVNPAYCNVGAGVAAAANGRTYYVLQAAYVSGKACGEYTSVGDANTQTGGSATENQAPPVSQLIIPVKIATPDADGKVFHLVQAGQSFWSIAIAYQITIKDIETWNNISRESKLLVGQRLFIPGENTAGYATPTPVGMVQTSPPGPDGKIVHTVQSYQTLTTIAQAYEVSVDRVLALNGIQIDWPLQIEQKLLIDPGNVTPSPTPRPLTPIEKLTPASDGQYYHTVSSGETLSWIAGYYEVGVSDLMAWNGLGDSTIIRPGQKLVLLVTPPVTATSTPRPVTFTATATIAAPTGTPTPTQAVQTPTGAAQSGSQNGQPALTWLLPLGLAAGGLILIGLLALKNRKPASI